MNPQAFIQDRDTPSATVYGPTDTYEIKPASDGNFGVFVMRPGFDQELESDWHLTFLAAMGHVASLVEWDANAPVVLEPDCGKCGIVHPPEMTCSEVQHILDVKGIG